MKKLTLIILTIFITLVTCLRTEAADLYEEQSLSVDSLETKIDVLENGTLNNTEIINFSSQPSLPFKWPIYASGVSNIKIKNGHSELTSKDFGISHSSDMTLLTVNSSPGNNSLWEITYTVSNKIKYYQDFSELNWIVAFKSGAYINQATVLVKTPSPLANNNFKQKIYSYGTESERYKRIDDQTLSYEGKNIDPAGNFTIVAAFSKNIIKPSVLNRMLSFLSSLNFLAGILLSLLILFVFWLVLKILSLRQKGLITPKKKVVLKSLPNEIPAALVGVLLNKKLGIREFAATILELARRGFLTVVKEKEKLYLIKRRPFTEAKPAERAMIDEIFSSQGNIPKVSIDLTDLKSAEKEKLSSEKISASSEHIYKIISALEYFKANPHEIYQKYLKVSIIIFIVSLIGIFASIPFINQYPIIIFIPIGFIISSLIIPERASGLSVYTKRGREMAYKWLAFRNYLSINTDQPKEDLEEFFRFLPYAIVMGVEKKWALQFSKGPFKIPSWLDIGYLSYDINDFVNKFLILVYDLSCTLIESRTPTAR